MCPNVKILLPSYGLFGRVWTRDFGNAWKKIKIRLYTGLLAFLKIESWPILCFPTIMTVIQPPPPRDNDTQMDLRCNNG